MDNEGESYKSELFLVIRSRKNSFVSFSSCHVMNISMFLTNFSFCQYCIKTMFNAGSL